MKYDNKESQLLDSKRSLKNSKADEAVGVKDYGTIIVLEEL